MRALIHRLRRSRRLDFLIFAAIVLALLVVLYLLDQRGALDVAGRARVIDGDSLEVAGVEMRLDGIDAPELAQTCTKQDAAWKCGQEAARRLKALLKNRDVRCAGATWDKHDRLLAKCRLGEVDVNRWMVEQGWAVSYHDFGDAERSARRAKRGLWAGTFERPRNWRDANRDSP